MPVNTNPNWILPPGAPPRLMTVPESTRGARSAQLIMQAANMAVNIYMKQKQMEWESEEATKERQSKEAIAAARLQRANIAIIHGNKNVWAFDKTTGVEQGYRLELDYSGTNDGREYEIYLIQEVTLNGYDLPDFYFDKPGALPGFEWFISIFAFSTIVITSVIIRRRKISR